MSVSLTQLSCTMTQETTHTLINLSLSGIKLNIGQKFMCSSFLHTWYSIGDMGLGMQHNPTHIAIRTVCVGTKNHPDTYSLHHINTSHYCLFISGWGWTIIYIIPLLYNTALCMSKCKTTESNVFMCSVGDCIQSLMSKKSKHWNECCSRSHGIMNGIPYLFTRSIQ